MAIASNRAGDVLDFVLRKAPVKQYQFIHDAVEIPKGMPEVGMEVGADFKVRARMLDIARGESRVPELAVDVQAQLRAGAGAMERGCNVLPRVERERGVRAFNAIPARAGSIANHKTDTRRRIRQVITSDDVVVGTFVHNHAVIVGPRINPHGNRKIAAGQVKDVAASNPIIDAIEIAAVAVISFYPRGAVIDALHAINVVDNGVSGLIELIPANQTWDRAIRILGLSDKPTG